MKIRTLTILFILLVPGFLLSQVTTSGKITDAKTGTPLIGVTIHIVGEDVGTITDANGHYSIQNNGKSLYFTYIGYEDFIVENPTDTLDVQMTIGTIFIPHCYVLVVDKRIKSAHNYSLLETKDIALQDLSNLTPILNTSPGVFMHSGALNTNRITIRGIGSRSPFSTNKIKAYLNEIPLTNGSGETTIEDIDLSFIKDIEIWKGPSGSSYGAGLGGMIALNSFDQRFQPSYVNVQQSVGSCGLYRNAVNVRLNNDKKEFAVHLNHNLTTSDGYRDNNSYRRQGGTILADGTLGSDRIQLLLAYTDLKAFIPSSLNESDYLNEPTKAAFTWGRVKGFEDYSRLLAGLSYEYVLNHNFKMNYGVFLNQKKSYELRPFNILTENSLSMGTRAWLQWTPENTSNLSFKMGTEAFRENYDWNTFETNDDGDLLAPLSINTEKRTYLNLFGETIYALFDKWKINGGLNFNTTQYDLEDRFFSDSIDISGDYAFDPVWSPRVTLTYSPKYNNDYYLLVSHGFSPPTLEETLAPDGTINPEIQPEMAWNFELGTRSYFANHRLKYEVSLYSMLVRDLLVARRTDFDQFIGVNAGKTRHNGLELHLQYDLIKRTEKELALQVNYAYADYIFLDFIDEEVDYSGNELTGTVPHQLNTVLSWQHQRFYGNVNFQFTDAQPLRDDNSIYSDAYSLLHAKVGYQLALGTHWSFDLYRGVNNVLDEQYAGMHQINAGSFGGSAPRYYYPGLPRNYYVGLKADYRFSE